MNGPLPRFHNVWEPRHDLGDATFFFVELLATIPHVCECGCPVVQQSRRYHVIVVSASGDYVSPPLNV